MIYKISRFLCCILYQSMILILWMHLSTLKIIPRTIQSSCFRVDITNEYHWVMSVISIMPIVSDFQLSRDSSLSKSYLNMSQPMQLLRIILRVTDLIKLSWSSFILQQLLLYNIICILYEIYFKPVVLFSYFVTTIWFCLLLPIN